MLTLVAAQAGPSFGIMHPLQAPQRWITSVLLHQNFMHLLSNCLLFVGLTSQMEAKYGTWRVVLLWVLSAVGGNLFR
jgi:membrane associated rhomboid family serine protease